MSQMQATDNWQSSLYRTLQLIKFVDSLQRRLRFKWNRCKGSASPKAEFAAHFIAILCDRNTQDWIETAAGIREESARVKQSQQLKFQPKETKFKEVWLN
jgi:hypothetical protein